MNPRLSTPLRRRRARRTAQVMTVRSLFATKLFEAELGDDGLLADLAHSIRSLAVDDQAGQRWSREHHYAGYTSYASLNDLPRRDPTFAELAKLLTKHASKFADERDDGEGFGDFCWRQGKDALSARLEAAKHVHAAPPPVIGLAATV